MSGQPVDLEARARCLAAAIDSCPGLTADEKANVAIALLQAADYAETGLTPELATNRLVRALRGEES